MIGYTVACTEYSDADRCPARDVADTRTSLAARVHEHIIRESNCRHSEKAAVSSQVDTAELLGIMACPVDAVPATVAVWIQRESSR